MIEAFVAINAQIGQCGVDIVSSQPVVDSAIS